MTRVGWWTSGLMRSTWLRTTRGSGNEILECAFTTSFLMSTRNWNKFVGEYNAVVVPRERNFGRPLAASQVVLTRFLQYAVSTSVAYGIRLDNVSIMFYVNAYNRQASHKLLENIYI
jgi:hypothetical protein